MRRADAVIITRIAELPAATAHINHSRHGLLVTEVMNIIDYTHNSIYSRIKSSTISLRDLFYIEYNNDKKKPATDATTTTTTTTTQQIEKKRRQKNP